VATRRRRQQAQVRERVAALAEKERYYEAYRGAGLPLRRYRERPSRSNWFSAASGTDYAGVVQRCFKVFCLVPCRH
jgi:hypothetical protein